LRSGAVAAVSGAATLLGAIAAPTTTVTEMTSKTKQKKTKKKKKKRNTRKKITTQNKAARPAVSTIGLLLPFLAPLLVRGVFGGAWFAFFFLLFSSIFLFVCQTPLSLSPCLFSVEFLLPFFL
jgi:uncharacterized membrane protein